MIADLLAVALARSSKDVGRMEPEAVSLLQQWRPQQLGDLSFDALQSAAGFERFEATRLQCAIELGRRAEAAAKGGGSRRVDKPEDVFELFRHLSREKEEVVRMLTLSTINEIITERELHRGTLDSSLISVRSIFRQAIADNARHVILVHNHPSGDPTPSRADIGVTRQVEEAGRLLEIELRDHVVIGGHSFVSMRREGHCG